MLKPQHHKAKLTDLQVRHLCKLWRQGYAIPQLSEWFGISRPYTWQIVNGKARVKAQQEGG